MLVINPLTVQKIYQMRSEGMTIRRLAQIFRISYHRMVEILDHPEKVIDADREERILLYTERAQREQPLFG